MIELGRYLVGPAGIYVCRVVDRKISRGHVFLVTDGGLHHHLAASGNFGQVIRKNYPVEIGNRIEGSRRETASVVGPLCTPLDLLADRMDLAEAQPGDLVVVFQSGAYGLTASPHGIPESSGPRRGALLSAATRLVRRPPAKLAGAARNADGRRRAAPSRARVALGEYAGGDDRPRACGPVPVIERTTTDAANLNAAAGPGIAVAASGRFGSASPRGGVGLRGGRRSAVSIRAPPPIVPMRDGAAAGWIEAYRERGPEMFALAHGAWSIVLVDLAQKRAIAAVDRFAMRQLCFRAKRRRHLVREPRRRSARRRRDRRAGDLRLCIPSLHSGAAHDLQGRRRVSTPRIGSSRPRRPSAWSATGSLASISSRCRLRNARKNSWARSPQR